MTWKTRLLLRESAFTATAFTAAVYFYYLVAVWGMQDFFIGGPLTEYLTSSAVHVELLMTGLLLGGLIGVINRVIQTPRFRRRPMGQVVVIMTLLYLASLAVVCCLVVLVFATLIFPWEDLSALFSNMHARTLLSFVTYMVVVVGTINFSIEIGRLVGPGNLWRLFIGRYRRPGAEKRIFLFMDLKGSTAIAEQLGHRRYSELLQECYRDLTQVVLQYGATITQYVGDEIVMSWPCTESGHTAVASVQAFFAYRDALGRKTERYRERFGLQPEFRGGVDAGTVTVIEVGDVKREIVYHGDVLNTASRLLELCKKKEEALVVSSAVWEIVTGSPSILMRWHEEVSLRGKRERIDAFALHMESR